MTQLASRGEILPLTDTAAAEKTKRVETFYN
jgi:hypothetical protein